MSEIGYIYQNSFEFETGDFLEEVFKKYKVSSIEGLTEKERCEICLFYIIPEQVLDNHFKCLNSQVISTHQPLSMNFIKKYLEELDFDGLVINKNINEDELKFNFTENYFASKLHKTLITDEYKYKSDIVRNLIQHRLQLLFGII